MKDCKGITLVALVLTIAVTLILGGVSLSVAIGENGIISKSEIEKNITEQEIQDSESERNIIMNELSKEKTEIDISSIVLPRTEGTKPYLPSRSFTKVAGTNLDNGLVIKDSKGNEYVWIEVPNDGTGPNYQGLTKKSEYASQEYKKMEDAIKEYTKDYRVGFDDIYYADSTPGWFIGIDDYNNAKNKMLKSVYENGGFYIGRYEAGIEKNRTAKGEATIEPMSKPNLYPYNYVTRTQAKVLAEKLSTSEYTNTLMFGMQWDLVLKYLETKGVTQTDLKTDSKNFGNYKNSEMKNINPLAKGSADNGKTYNYDLKQGKPINTTILLTTGASEYTNKQNIYDLAGNEVEWTLEKTTTTVNPCTYRGGCYINNGSNFSVFHHSNDSTSLSYFTVGFRFSLYK